MFHNLLQFQRYFHIHHCHHLHKTIAETREIWILIIDSVEAVIINPITNLFHRWIDVWIIINTVRIVCCKTKCITAILESDFITIAIQVIVSNILFHLLRCHRSSYYSHCPNHHNIHLLQDEYQNLILEYHHSLFLEYKETLEG